METESHKHGCPYCGLHFALPSSRRTHIQSHHSEKADVCELCSIKQGSKERLFAHLVEHHIVFECNRCMRKFYQREQLNSHMETHLEPVDCPWDGCSKKVNRSILSSHIRQHRIENESKCQTCGKAFSNRQMLSLHMDIHAKAETNAKAILNTVNSNANSSSTQQHNAVILKGTNTPTIQGLQSSAPVSTPAMSSSVSSAVAEVPSVGTTLISITTPPTNLAAIKPKTSPRSYTARGGQLRRQRTSVPSRSTNAIPQGLRIMCCSCNQLFNSHNELSNHKCVVPVVTITGPDGSSIEELQNQNQLVISKAENSSATYSNSNYLRDETTSDNLEEDPEKLVLDLAAQLTQAVQAEEAEKLKQKQMQKVEQLMNQQAHNQQKQQQSQLQHQVQQPMQPSSQMGINRNRRTYSSLKSNQVKESTEMIKANENPIQEIKTREENVIAPESQQILTFDQQAVVGNELDKAVEQLPGGEEQCIVIQQPDGQLVQLSVPAGMDLEEVVRSLNIAWASGAEIATEMEQIQQDPNTCIPPTAEQIQEQMQAAAAAAVAGGDGVSSEADQHVIYLPVNEDGTCAIDATALAMLTGNGDVPIIVTSSN